MVEPKILVLAQEGVGGHVENVRQALDVLQTGIGAVAFPILDRCNADARSARQFLLREFVLRAELGDLFADHGITSIAIPYTTTGKKKGCYHRAKTFASSYPREEWMPSYEQEKFFAVRTRAGAPEHGGRFPPL